MTDLTELKKLAKAATPGPWDADCDEGEGEVEVNAGTARTSWVDHGNGIMTGTPPRSWRVTDRIVERDDLWDEDFEQAAADADFIAAANPSTVLALIAQIEAVTALHAPEIVNPELTVCAHCRSSFPCHTARAVSGSA